MQITEQRSPNVIAHSYTLDTGTIVTIFKSSPGDTTPRMQMQMPGGDPIDCGPIDNPERFGPYGTPVEFAAWVENFAENA